ncbi:MAG TPA: hypothetical protein VLL76_08150 [Candidatus Omnitrophota bacterium]|nr:hypothetical protein [Candidatus Omnitrophota bacterium]
MSLAALLSSLYAVCGVAACLFYVPQLRRLARDAEARRAMSLVTWGGWLAVGVVSLLYAAIVVGETEMIVVAGLNWLCQAAVFGLALAQRLSDR